MTYLLNNSIRTHSLTLQLIILMSWCSFSSADKATINIASDPWCPYICDSDDNHQGILVDIAREALAISGFKLNLKIINWARAKHMVKTGEFDGIIGMAYTKEAGDLYYFSNTPIGQTQICFYRRENDNWQYQSPASLTNRTFGWINHYIYTDPPLDKWVMDHKNGSQVLTISGTDIHQRSFKLLQSYRIDAFAEDRNVIVYELAKSEFDSKIQIAGCLNSVEKSHLAFSLKAKNKELWAKALDYGVDQLDKNGRLEEILSYYGLTKETWMDTD
mgnify:CR=1 FL=1